MVNKLLTVINNCNDFFIQLLIYHLPLSFIPIFVPRPAAASLTRSPFPLMITARTFSARFKRVPHRAASVIEKFGRVRVGAKPAARGSRLPFAQRTTNALKIRFILFFLQFFENFFGFGSLPKHVENRVKKNRIFQQANFSNLLRHIFKF